MILPDTKIICPKCAIHIATTVSFLDYDKKDKCVYLDDLDWQSKAYEKYCVSHGGKCPKCTTNWSDTGGWIHTSSGWELT